MTKYVLSMKCPFSKSSMQILIAIFFILCSGHNSIQESFIHRSILPLYFMNIDCQVVGCFISCLLHW